MKLRWAERAIADLLGIAEYIEADDAAAARAWVDRLRVRAGEAASSPRAGRVVPELGREDVREVFLGTYRVVYRVTGKDVVILTVFEGHRLLGKLEPNEG